MKLQSVLDKFDEKFTTIEVIECSDDNIISFNKFDVVPVRCDISYFWSDDMEVEETFYVDKVTLDNSDDTLTFELADRTKEMLNIDEIISLEVTKISKKEYLQAIKDDDDLINRLQ